MAEGDTPAWRLLRGLRAYWAAYESQAEPPAFEDGASFPVRIQSEADRAARDPWRIEAWENPFARDGPASPFLAGEAMLEAEGSATARPAPAVFSRRWARASTGCGSWTGAWSSRSSGTGRAAQVRVTKDDPLLAGGGFRICRDYEPEEVPLEIARLTALWSVSGGPGPRQGRVRWARNGNC